MLLSDPQILGRVILRYRSAREVDLLPRRGGRHARGVVLQLTRHFAGLLLLDIRAKVRLVSNALPKSQMLAG